MAGRQAFCLTGAPGAFGEMMRAAGVHVDNARTAEQVARAFVETTREMYVFTTLVDSAEEIRWAGGPGGAPSAELASQLRALVKPPAAVPAGPGRHEVTVFVLAGAELQRRVLTITSDCTVTERTESMISGLPVPISM